MVKRDSLLGRFARYGVGRLLPDRLYVILDYKKVFGVAPDLKNPKAYSEKLQWLKLYDRKPIYKTLTDKLAVREYITEKGGSEYLIPLLGVYDKYEDIDFDSLPERFVLKPNHSSGDIFFCEDKSEIDHKTLKKMIRRWLRKDYYLEHREWNYKGIERKILCEKYLEREGHGLAWNYKFYCFNGKPFNMYITCEGGHDGIYSFFDLDLNPLPVFESHRVVKTLEKPEGYDKMLEIVRELAKPFFHIRMDMYLISGRVYIGEFTLHSGSGLVKWEPREYDMELGNMLKLPGID